MLVARLLPGLAGDRAADICFSRQAGGLLFRHTWPGNVRALKKSLQVALLRCQDNTIRLKDLSDPSMHLKTSRSEASHAEAREAAELRALYEQCQGNVSAMARALKTSRSQVSRLLVRYRITNA